MAPPVASPTWTRPAAENGPKRAKNILLLIFDGFGTDVGLICHDSLNEFRLEIKISFLSLRSVAKLTRHFPQTLAQWNPRKRTAALV